MKVETKMVSPEMAEQLLETNPDNRAVSYNRVQQLVTAMRNGKWQLNGETLIVSVTGKLLDGQHRLYAVREYGKPVEMIIVTGVPDKSFETIDTGRTRTAVDIARLSGKELTGLEVAAASNIWRLWHQTRMSEVCPAHVVMQVADKFPAIHKWGRFVSSAAQKRTAPAGPLLTSLTYLEDIAKKPLAAERFFRGVVKGDGLPDGDPLLTLRNRLILMRGERQILNMHTTWSMFARTLTALEAGEQLYRIQQSYESGTGIRPKLWDHHVEALPKAVKLDYLAAPMDIHARKRDLFNEVVEEHRDRARQSLTQKKA